MYVVTVVVGKAGGMIAHMFAAVSCTITGQYVTKGHDESLIMVEKLRHIEKVDVNQFRVGCFKEWSNKIKEKWFFMMEKLLP
jgi:hypothetical protein